eukprot:6551884-Pyramimonas_sp.AAC.1
MACSGSIRPPLTDILVGTPVGGPISEVLPARCSGAAGPCASSRCPPALAALAPLVGARNPLAHD